MLPDFASQTKVRFMRVALSALAAALLFAAPAHAQEVYGGVYAHGVDTPFTFDTGEGGVDVQAGYRFAPIEALSGDRVSPQPHVFASVNLNGDTNFGGVGLTLEGRNRRHLPAPRSRPRDP